MSLQRIAQQTGVSLSTVSRALRNHPRISPQTIARVQAAAAAIKYAPNPVISDLMRRVRRGPQGSPLGTLAYLTFNLTAEAWRRSPTYLSFYLGAEQRARELGWSLEAFWARAPGLNARRLTHILQTRAIAGVIVGPRPIQPRTDLLDWSQFPSAGAGLPLPPELPLHQSSSHHDARLMERLLEALEARDYRRPGLVLVGPQLAKTDPGWWVTWSFRQSQMAAKNRVPLLHRQPLELKVFEQWYRRYKPDVIIGLQEVADLLSKCGLRIPEDVAFAHLARPEGRNGPAGMDQQGKRIGAGAVDLLVGQMLSGERGIPDTPRLLLTLAKWVDGDTARRAN